MLVERIKGERGSPCTVRGLRGSRLHGCVCTRMHSMRTPSRRWLGPSVEGVSVHQPVWVCILHRSLVCVHLHVCLSLCAWAQGPMCMSVHTPQVSWPSADITLGQVANCVVGEGRWEVVPCSPDLALPLGLQAMGAPGGARLCKAEACPGEAPGEGVPGDWPGFLPPPQGSSPPSVPPPPLTPCSRAACPLQSTVILHSTPQPCA